MTLDEAIEHAEERACGNDQYHAQLADWLRELREARITIEILKIFRDGFKEDAQKYKDENAKLQAERDYLFANSNPTAAELRRVRSAWKKDRDENEKLREFVQYVADGVYKGLLCCNGCRFFAGCYNNEKKEHDGRGCQWLLWSRELGVEADE